MEHLIAWITQYGYIAIFMLLMLGIGVFSMRFNRGASDYFKGGGRIHWLAAGLSSFMSGFSRHPDRLRRGNRVKCAFWQQIYGSALALMVRRSAQRWQNE